MCPLQLQLCSEVMEVWGEKHIHAQLQCYGAVPRATPGENPPVCNSSFHPALAPTQVCPTWFPCALVLSSVPVWLPSPMQGTILESSSDVEWLQPTMQQPGLSKMGAFSLCDHCSFEKTAEVSEKILVNAASMMGKNPKWECMASSFRVKIGFLYLHSIALFNQLS